VWPPPPCMWAGGSRQAEQCAQCSVQVLCSAGAMPCSTTVPQPDPCLRRTGWERKEEREGLPSTAARRERWEAASLGHCGGPCQQVWRIIMFMGSLQLLGERLGMVCFLRACGSRGKGVCCTPSRQAYAKRVNARRVGKPAAICTHRMRERWCAAAMPRQR